MLWLWLTLAHCPALSGSLWLSLALSGSLWLSLARCPALSGSLWLSLAPSGSLRLSLALRICLQSPCLAHKALARLIASLLRYSTLISPELLNSYYRGRKKTDSDTNVPKINTFWNLQKHRPWAELVNQLSPRHAIPSLPSCCSWNVDFPANLSTAFHKLQFHRIYPPPQFLD